jgi:hypothetical protein
MANTVTKTTILDGTHNLVILVNILGDGSGEETNTLIVDRSTFEPVLGIETTVRRVSGNFNGFAASLSFDATTDLPFVQLPPTWFEYDWNDFGGLSSNKAGAGTNGDILLSTVNLGANERGTFVLEMIKG